MASQTLSILSLIFGIISSFFFWIPLFGLLFPTLAIVLGIISLSNKKTNKGRGLSIAGIILGGVFGIISLFFLMPLIMSLFIHSSMSSYLNENSNYEGHHELNEDYSKYSALEVVNISCYYNERGNLEYKGSVMNKGDYTEGFVEVNITFYDSNKNEVGYALTFIEEDAMINPNETADFFSYYFKDTSKIIDCSAKASGMII
ncbi:MAG: hypothetical protein ABIJ14_02345 [Nanoarchaeota archaeon]